MTNQKHLGYYLFYLCVNWNLNFTLNFYCYVNLIFSYLNISIKESTCQFRRYKRYRFGSQARKSPWRRKCHPIFLLPQYSCWEIPWTDELDGLQLVQSQRVGHIWTSAHTAIFFFVLKWSLKLFLCVCFSMIRKICIILTLKKIKILSQDALINLTCLVIRTSQNTI